jgi:hypothetical protein
MPGEVVDRPRRVARAPVRLDRLATGESPTFTNDLLTHF